MRIATFFGLPKVIALVAVALALGGGAYAFTASSVVWTPDATNPANIQKVAFTLSTVTASTVVYAGADNGSSIQWSSACTQGTITSGSATETCTFATQPTSSSVTKLAVSAAN